MPQGATVAAAALVLGIAQAAPAQTFNRDVAPILYANCISCHRVGEAAPMPLVTFADARPWARAIKAKVATHEMPPWFADPRVGQFSNAPKLTDAQIATLVAWADAGAPEGDGAPPAAPMLQEGWSSLMNRPPDRIIDAPVEFETPATGEVPVFTVWVKSPFRDDTFVEAVQLLPTNRHVVHHSSLSLGMLPPRTKIGKAALWANGPVLDGVPIDNKGQPYRAMSGDEFGYPMVFYVPGGGFLRFPQGVAKRIREGEYFSWGMHYVTTGKPEKVRMRLGLWLAKKSVTHEALSMTVNVKRIVEGKEVSVDAHGMPQIPRIPAGAANWSMTGVLPLRDAVTLYSLWPHMHFRGKDMTFIVTYPNGKEETLLSVPHYNPQWQMTYELAKPMKIPARSVIRAEAHYDNSANNPHNPAPDQDVIWGPQAENEMFLPFIEVSVDNDDLRFENLQQRLQ